MKKIFALMDGEKILEKSEHRNQLSNKRDELKESGKKNVYVCTWLGAIQLDERGNILSAKVEDENN